jgi:hypothetical protein
VHLAGALSAAPGAGAIWVSDMTLGSLSEILESRETGRKLAILLEGEWAETKDENGETSGSVGCVYPSDGYIYQPLEKCVLDSWAGSR